MTERCSYHAKTDAFGDKQCVKPAGHDKAHIIGSLSISPDNVERFEEATRSENERAFKLRSETRT